MLSAVLPFVLAATLLPTGARLDPAAPSHPAGNFPLAIAVAPGGERVALLLSGWRQQGVQIVDRSTGSVLQTLEQPAAFLGLAFSPDGQRLYASGGASDTIHVYRWNGGSATPDGTIALFPGAKKKATQYPAGLALTPDGRTLAVAENLGDSVAIVDTASRRVVQRLLTGRYPYAVAVSENEIYVSCWADAIVDVFSRNSDGFYTRAARIPAGRHPSALLLSGHLLYAASASTDTIAVIDVEQRRVVRTLSDPPPSGPHEGAAPNALAISADGSRLFAAEADANAVAVFDTASGALLGRVPAEWYPAAIAVAGDRVLVANAKGTGTKPNPEMRLRGRRAEPRSPHFVLGQINGTLMEFAIPDEKALAAFTARVAAANGWDRTRTAAQYPPFRHVIYVIKENRTYDQVLGDLGKGDGDPSLVYFPRSVSPNHHALAERFGVFDRFFVNAEVSAQGHNWSTAAWSSDYVEKCVPSSYSDRGREYDYEGTNRDKVVDDEDDVAAPSTGYLWDAAARKGITFRNYGEYVSRGDWIGLDPEMSFPTRRVLQTHSHPDYPGFDLTVTDRHRVDVWERDFAQFTASGEMPALQIVRLPNDHTSGATAGRPTPRVYMADNDLALGRLIERLSHSRFWRDTVVFVLEDDAQDGPDHVDSHRSLLYVISAWNAPGVIHRFVNTTDVLATIEEILGLESLSQFDHYGRPLRGIFRNKPDLTPYSAKQPEVDWNEKNPKSPESKKSAELDLSRADAIDDDAFNRILWRVIKGRIPYPGPTRAPAGIVMER